jgi:hypothetical protein
MRTVTAVLALALLGGCASTSQDRGRLSATPTPTTSPTITNATFFLTVSNQSFQEPSVVLTVTIDGKSVIDRAFEVKGQHNFVGFPFELRPGKHTLLATAPSGTRRQASFEIPAAGKRYGVLFYWNDGQAVPYFSWQFQPTKPVFG